MLPRPTLAQALQVPMGAELVAEVRPTVIRPVAAEAVIHSFRADRRRSPSEAVGLVAVGPTVGQRYFQVLALVVEAV